MEKKESSVIFGLPKDISKFRGDYGAEPIIELAAMETNKNGGNIYLGTIGEGKDNLFHIDEDIPAMAALHTRDFRAMRKNAKRFNDKNFATSKTRFNIKNKPRLESKFCNGKMLYTINDMKTGLLIRLENVESMKNIELGENLLYSAKLSYKHVNDNEVTASRRVAFELYTAMEFIQSKSEAELLGNFFSQKEVKFDENPKHITYLGNLHMDGVVTKTEKVEQGIRRKNREIDRRNIAQRINVSNIEHKKVDLDKSQTPNTERE